jgi:hypothetical protein
MPNLNLVFCIRDSHMHWSKNQWFRVGSLTQFFDFLKTSIKSQINFYEIFKSLFKLNIGYLILRTTKWMDY